MTTRTKLDGIHTLEVSVVPRGKNRKTIAIAKECDVTDVFDIDEIAKALDTINQEIELEEDGSKALDELLEKADMSDKQKAAIRGALKMLAAAGDAVPDDLKKKLAGLVGYGYPAPTKKEAGDDDDKDNDDKDKTEDPPVTTFLSAATLLKEDGTVNDEAINAMPEEQRPAMQAIAKELADNRKRADDAEKLAKEERDKREHREWLSKAEALEHLSGKAEERATLLKSLADKDPEAAQKLYDEFKKADEAIKQSAIFQEAGSGAPVETDAEKRLESLAKELVEKADDLTFEQAYTRVLDTPEGKRLYAESLNA